MDRIVDGQSCAHSHDDDRVFVDLNANNQADSSYYEQDEQRGQHAYYRHLDTFEEDQDSEKDEQRTDGEGKKPISFQLFLPYQQLV